MNLPLRLRFLLPLLAATTLHAGDPGPTYDVKSGTVSFAFNAGVIFGSSELTAVKVKAIGPGAFVARKLTVSAPIVSGALQLSDAHAEINGSGGFRLSYQGKTVSLVDFAFTLPVEGSSTAGLSAIMTDNGEYLGRVLLTQVDIVDLNIPLPVVIPPNRKLALKNIPITLSTHAAGLLNAALGISGYNGTDIIGTLNLSFKMGGRL